MKRIVIATDGSAGSRAAVTEGIALAQALGAAVTFVSVRPPVPQLLGEPLYARRLSGQLSRARAAVGEGVAEAEEAGVEADYEILEGDPVGEVLRIARLRHAELVVVGSRGLGAVPGALLGSVSRAIVRGSDRPVLVTKAGSRVEPVRRGERRLAPPTA